MRKFNLFLLVAVACTLLSCAHGGGFGTPGKSLPIPRKPQGNMSDGDHKMPASGWLEDASTDCTKVGLTTKITKKQQAVIDRVIATQGHRVQHALWHSVRGGLNPGQISQVKSTWGSSWGDAHPVCPPPGDNADDGQYNPTGEDFLYMHRQMILMLRQEFVKSKVKCIQGWERFSDFEKFPVPGKREGPKTDEALARFKAWDDYFQNPEWLKSVSLSQLGLAIEFTIHNNLHMRFAEDRPAKEFRGKAPDGSEDGAVVPLDGKFPKKWNFDSPKYNWLADPYGAAVNPTFWRIHGYVDHIINLWLKANGKSKIAVMCGGDANCYEWRGTWIGSIDTAMKKGPGGLTAGPRQRRTKEEEVEDNIRFLKARRAFQEIGVIPKETGKVGVPRASKEPDPFQTVKARLCPGS